MRIIFLDIDGVLNSTGYFASLTAAEWDEFGEACQVDPALVARLNRVVRAAGAMVVVSSSWRHGRTPDQLEGVLRARGFCGFVLDKTPDFVMLSPEDEPLSRREYGQRGDEIRQWLDLNSERHSVESFVVLDDNSDMDAVRDRFVQTDMRVGLSDEDVRRAIGILARDT